MLEYLRMGGFPTVVILVLSAFALVSAGRFVARPDPRHLESLRALTLAIVFAVMAGVAAGFVAVMTHVAAFPPETAPQHVAVVLMTGLGECMTVAVLGFGLLMATWILLAVGQRRLARQL